MKRVLTAFILLFLFLLAGCQSGETFEGTVIRLDEYSVIVEPSEGEDIRRSGTEVSIPVEEDLNLEVGDRVRVTHEGPVMESYPLQINLIEIERID
ncbi:hypothetical protein SAMN04488100_1169 [Alkalibacterium putridalgicola]|jgi:predicted small secreted protein|uniref:DUF3221 domain-containing protein n=1 Tax=Alkalibacterium putridalgicola TaxID=426703 RepID=A0A1H7U762_9LACT|nr:DUF3221 domain-containing protein [Alkalibacterium putridalgicola]GEK89625.1 hypothetical protein APU01nite_16640 [Alkalibacterium putridalgicola]SEL92619.1 hypothetical protein SAMN04488100_1169 [Alkalibacterium putridalgicola]